MARVAVMGDTESIKGFAALGLDIFPCDREEEAAPLFRRLTAGGEYGVVFLTERLFVLLEKDVKRLDDQLLPAVIPIPGVTGDTGVGIRRLSGSVERAVGSDIIFGGKDRMGV